MDKKLMKKELRVVAENAIAKFLSSARGAAMFGSKAELAAVDYNTLQLRVPTPNGPEYFLVKVTAPI